MKILNSGEEQGKGFTRTFIAIEMSDTEQKTDVFSQSHKNQTKDFSDEVIKEVARLQEILSAGVKFTGKVTELENLHLTLKFLGEIDEEKLKETKKRLKTIKFEPMKLKLGKVGTFSIRGNPSIVWVKIEGKEIHELQKKVDDALVGLFKPEDRFMSHLTIARIKYVKDKKGFLERVSSMNAKPIEFGVSEFKLKRSELKPLGPVYSDLEAYPSKNSSR